MAWDEWRKAANDETKWVNHHEKGLLKAEYLRDYILRLWFEEELDVAIYELDWKPLLVDEEPGAAMSALRNLERFSFVKGDYALIWPNPETGDYDSKAIDLAPECVRFFCEKYGKIVKKAKVAVVSSV